MIYTFLELTDYVLLFLTIFFFLYFRILPFSRAWTAMEKCFADDIFLLQLLDKFWRLVLQIISRLNVWINNIFKLNVRIQKTTENPDFEHNANLKLKFLSFLHVDISNFISKLNDNLSFTNNYIPDVLREKIQLSLHEFIHSAFPQNLKSVENIIVDYIYKDCSQHVKNVSQIPRLYRKTNRSSPTTTSNYVSLMCKPIDEYEEQYKQYLSKEALNTILREVHKKISSEYKSLVSSVLTSVAKTEESLRRLKKTRAGSEPPSGEGSDDQKIRLQLQLDVDCYARLAKEYCNVTELVTLVKDAALPKDTS